MSDPIVDSFSELYGIDPFTPIYMVVDDENAPLNGMFKQPLISAILGWLDEEPNFNVSEYVQAWKDYFENYPDMAVGGRRVGHAPRCHL